MHRYPCRKLNDDEEEDTYPEGFGLPLNRSFPVIVGSTVSGEQRRRRKKGKERKNKRKEPSEGRKTTKQLGRLSVNNKEKNWPTDCVSSHETEREERKKKEIKQRRHDKWKGEIQTETEGKQKSQPSRVTWKKEERYKIRKEETRAERDRGQKQGKEKGPFFSARSSVRRRRKRTGTKIEDKQSNRKKRKEQRNRRQKRREANRKPSAHLHEGFVCFVFLHEFATRVSVHGEK